MIKKFKNEENNLTPTPLLEKEREKLLQNEESLANSGEVKKCGSCFAPFNGLARLRSTSALRRKCAFSLAEAMIMLVIVTILMGLFAPLVAKKSAADLKNFRYFILPNNTGQELYNSTNTSLGKVFTSVFGALGDNQNFGIGTNSPNAKLHIQGTNANADILNVTARQITPPAAGDNAERAALRAAADTGLFVNKNGEANIVACVPDWANNIAVNTALRNDGVNDVFTNDGYLLVKNCADITAGGNLYKVCPSVSAATFRCIDFDAGKCTEEKFETLTTEYYNSSILIPVNANLTYAIERGDAPGAAGRRIGIPYYTGADNNRFIPCDNRYKAYKRGS